MEIAASLVDRYYYFACSLIVTLYYSFSCALAKAQAVGSLLKEIIDQEMILKIMIENGA